MAVDVVGIHTEPSGSTNMQHITKLKWIETTAVGIHGSGGTNIATRLEMYDFVKDNPGQAYAISRNDNQWAYLEAVDNGHTKYVRTMPDSTKSDNLLSLPRF